MVCVLPYSWGDQTPTIYKIFFLPISSSAPVTAPPCLWNSHPLCITRRALLFSVSSSPCPEQAHHVSTFWGLALSPPPALCFQPLSGHVNCCLIAPLTQHTQLSPLSSHLSLFPVLYWHHQPPLLL